MRVRRLRVALGAEQLVEPRVAQAAVRLRRRIRRGDEHTLELAQRDRLLLLVARDGIGLAGDLGLEPLARLEQPTPVGVEARRGRALQLAELFAIGVRLEHREPGLRGAQRQLLALEGHARPEDRVLERILLLGELGRDEAGLARLAQPVEPLALVTRRGVLRLPQRLDLRTREEIAIRRDDRRLLGDLLLADPNGAGFFGALEVVLLELRLVLGGVADGGGRHRSSLSGAGSRPRAASRATVSSSSIVNGLPSTASACIAPIDVEVGRAGDDERPGFAARPRARRAGRRCARARPAGRGARRRRRSADRVARLGERSRPRRPRSRRARDSPGRAAEALARRRRRERRVSRPRRHRAAVYRRPVPRRRRRRSPIR